MEPAPSITVLIDGTGDHRKTALTRYNFGTGTVSSKSCSAATVTSSSRSLLSSQIEITGCRHYCVSEWAQWTFSDGVCWLGRGMVGWLGSVGTQSMTAASPSDTFSDTWVQGGSAAVHVQRSWRGVHHREWRHRPQRRRKWRVLQM